MVARTYLDWNATAPLRREAREAMVGALDLGGNPSSVHAEGRAARRVIEEARVEVALLVGTEPRNVVFTSGGTEANALALTPLRQAKADAVPRDRLLVSAIEHASVLSGGRFAPEAIEEIPVRGDGRVDLDALEQRLASLGREGCRALVSIMLANNETGIIQPVQQAAGLVHAAGGLLHVDAVQGVGRMSCTIKEIGADLMTLSGHKIGGPKGVGALVCRDDAVRPPALIRGGGQERSLRAGTENVAGIAGFGAAARVVRACRDREIAAMRLLRDRMEAGIRATAPDAVIFGAGFERLPNTTLVAVPGTKAETAVIALDLDGVAVSAGAACSSGKVQASHVLAAMGVDRSLARGAIRVSIGPETLDSEVDRFLAAWTKLRRSLHKAMGGLAA
jgi:cysteine desulfurase